MPPERQEMSRQLRKPDYVSFDDFEEMLLDKPEEEKWELLGGVVVRSMVGARWEHNRIVANILTFLMTELRLKRSPCRPFAESFWLKQRFLDLAAFPDVIVSCGEMEKEATFIDDPVVLFEVVSPTSQGRDRSVKWTQYRKLPSLMHYVLVERDRVLVDVWDRIDKKWQGREPMERLDETLALPAIGVEMPLVEVYREVIGA
jgi:Uma2 family endonuclease